MTIECLLSSYFSGKTEGANGNKGNGNVKIAGNRILHYSTTLLERKDDYYILNASNYSRTSGVLRNRIKDMLREKRFKYIEVKRVPINYDGSLCDYIEE